MTGLSMTCRRPRERWHTHLRIDRPNIPNSAAKAHQVILWDEVGETEGTGIVHIAPVAAPKTSNLGA